MKKKSIIAVLSAVVLMVVASIAMVFTIGPKTSADSTEIPVVPYYYLYISNGVLGDGDFSGAFNADGKTWIQNHAKYRVEIPEGVTRIGGRAFSRCSGLTGSIAIPEGVTSIGSRAFSGCSGLTSITIPEGVTGIDQGTFSGCSDLTSITIPDSVTSIGSSAFGDCYSLTSITIPENVTSIGDYAFNNCHRLTSITIPEGVSIGDNAFMSCSGLTSITIPAGVSIGRCAFISCTGLTSVTISEGMTSIGDYVFYNCSGLTSITIPESVTSIGESTFSSCSGLISITIPKNVTSIGESAFNWCSGLNEIIVRNPDLMTNTNLQGYASKLHYGAEQNTVTFNTMGGSAVDNQTINFGEYANESAANPTQAGYTLMDWYKDAQYTQPFTFDTPIKYDITLYAKWEENPTVTFMIDGTEYSSETIEYNTSVTVPTEPTKTGYTFMGWYRNNAAYDFNTLVTENITLTAKWNINRYMVDFYGQGTPVDSVFVNHGDLVTEPTISRKGYTLLGWFVDDEIDQKFNFNTPITDNIGLWAKWSINQYNVIFDSDGGNAVAPQRNVEYNTLLTVPETPTREGYNFLGWYNGDEAYDFTTPVSQDMTLTAKWESNQPDEPETPDEETSTEVNNQNNNGWVWGILGTSGGILLVGGIVFGIVIAKRRRR